MDELGLVSGDRLYVLCSQEDRGQASCNSLLAPTGNTHSGQIGEETSRTCSRLTEDSVCVEKQPEANSLVEQELVVDETSGAVVHYSHLVELLTGERAVDSSCTNGDLLCFALHMIMRDSGYQPNVSCFKLSHSLHTHSHSLSLSLSLTHSHSLTHTLTHSLTHTHTHTNIHTHSLTHPLTHTHT